MDVVSTLCHRKKCLYPLVKVRAFVVVPRSAPQAQVANTSARSAGSTRTWYVPVAANEVGAGGLRWNRRQTLDRIQG